MLWMKHLTHKNIRFAHWTVRTGKLTNTESHINNSRHVETRLKATFSND